MAERIKFTDRTIAALPLPAAGQRAEYADTETDGLRLRVTSSGVKTFSLLRRIRNGPMERITLGRFPDAYKTEAARTKAQEAERRHRRRREPRRSEAGAQGRADIRRAVQGIHGAPREAAQAHLARGSSRSTATIWNGRWDARRFPASPAPIWRRSIRQSRGPDIRPSRTGSRIWFRRSSAGRLHGAISTATRRRGSRTTPRKAASDS